MKSFVICVAAFLAVSGAGARAQSLSDLNIELHGYATQGFVYTNQNNWNTTQSTEGSPAWTDVVLNVTAQPDPKLRVAVQGRYFLLGNFGDSITLDWADGDYKVNSHLGVRFGKVKTPTGLFNEVQDIDPTQVWSLLPQSVYPIASRNSLLSHYGGVAYGDFELGKRLGTVEYRAFGGDRVISSGDGYLQPFRDVGITVPNGMTGPLFGGALHWDTPVQGLTIGASGDVQRFSANISVPVPVAPNVAVTVSGAAHLVPMTIPSYFGKLDKGRVFLGGEYSRIPFVGWIDLRALSGGLPLPSIDVSCDFRNWYFMGTYRFSDRFTAGAYYSSAQNAHKPLGPGRYQKDWTVSGRYNFNPFVYAKAEQHFMQGTETGFSAMTNTGGLQPNTRMSILKIGVSF